MFRFWYKYKKCHQNSWEFERCHLWEGKNGTLCPIPRYIRSVYVDKDTIYIYTPLGRSTLRFYTIHQSWKMWDHEARCSEWYICACYESFKRNHLQSLPGTKCWNRWKVSFKYNDTYIVPSNFDSPDNSFDGTYNIIDRTTYTKKWNIDPHLLYPTAPVYNSVPMVQDGETLYYILPGMAIYIQKWISTLARQVEFRITAVLL